MLRVFPLIQIHVTRVCVEVHVLVYHRGGMYVLTDRVSYLDQSSVVLKGWFNRSNYILRRCVYMQLPCGYATHMHNMYTWHMGVHVHIYTRAYIEM